MLKYMSTSCKPHKLAIAREIPKFKILFQMILLSSMYRGSPSRPDTRLLYC